MEMETAVDHIAGGHVLSWRRATRIVRWSLVLAVCALAVWSLVSWMTGLSYSGWHQWVVAAIGVGCGAALGWRGRIV